MWLYYLIDDVNTDAQPTSSVWTGVIPFDDFLGEAGGAHLHPGGWRPWCVAYNILLKKTCVKKIHLHYLRSHRVLKVFIWNKFNMQTVSYLVCEPCMYNNNSYIFTCRYTKWLRICTYHISFTLCLSPLIVAPRLMGNWVYRIFRRFPTPWALLEVTLNSAGLLKPPNLHSSETHTLKVPCWLALCAAP